MGAVVRNVAVQQVGSEKSTMSSARGALQLSRRAMMSIDPPVFTKSRFARRWNMMDEDRLKWYNWNLACIALTAVPLWWMATVNYKTCEDTNLVKRCLDPTGDLKIKYDMKLYG